MAVLEPCDSAAAAQQRHEHGVAAAELPQRIAAVHAAGLHVSALACGLHDGQDAWTLVLDTPQRTGFTDQVVQHFPDSFLPRDWIMARWIEGYYITALAGSVTGSGGCVVAMSRGTRYTQQSYKVAGGGFPSAWVDTKTRQGFRVTCVTTSAHRWAVLMTRNAGLGDQRVELDFAFPAEGLAHHWAAGYRLTCCAATADMVALICSKPLARPDGDAQEVLRAPAFPAQLLQARRANGMAVTALAFGRTYAARQPPPPGRPVPTQQDRAVIPWTQPEEMESDDDADDAD